MNSAMIDQLLKAINSHDILGFEKVWNDIENDISEKDKQKLLTEILDNYYSEKKSTFFIKVFDKIIDSKVSLDFSIDHWTPTFLSLAVHKSSQRLFDYFLKRGANVNFIGDSYVFETKKTIKPETKELDIERYSTCLDFAENKLADLLSVDYNYFVPDKDEEIHHWSEIDCKEEITIRKIDFYYLVEQSQYLQDLIHTDSLIDYIKSIGGKTYEELKK
ncbi:MAG: hypothetical protein JXR53_13550 [Bacteroidales bacterium]|nr:hypothetical protein [Bacteroidales bacterium]